MTPHYARVGKTRRSKYVNDESGVKTNVFYKERITPEKKRFPSYFARKESLKNSDASGMWCNSAQRKNIRKTEDTVKCVLTISKNFPATKKVAIYMHTVKKQITFKT